MSNPKLFAVYFTGEGPNAAYYERMIRVLDYTARKHCPGWDVELQNIGAAKNYKPDGVHSHISNTHKLDYWNRYAQTLQDGDRVLLMDGDMMILRPLDVIWNLEFDLAYTTKRGGKLPFNGGILFLRISEKTKRFMQAYWDKNIELLNHPTNHAKFRSKYGGMNQAAFGALLPELTTTYGLNVIEIPCKEWNCEQSAWHTYSPDFTRIVHVKSGLRKAIFGRGPKEPPLIPLIDLWKSLEKEAQRQEVHA